MDKLTWADVYGVWHDFVYNHTELAIWLGVSLVTFIMFWFVVYSTTMQRLIVIVFVILAVTYGLNLYGYIDFTAIFQGAPH